ncbi:hypothetical protein GCM10010483_47570 [Actinokineospora diospyrosa]
MAFFVPVTAALVASDGALVGLPSADPWACTGNRPVGFPAGAAAAALATGTGTQGSDWAVSAMAVIETTASPRALTRADNRPDNAAPQ